MVLRLAAPGRTQYILGELRSHRRGGKEGQTIVLTQFGPGVHRYIDSDAD
jgi:hypothetical protein